MRGRGLRQKPFGDRMAIAPHLRYNPSRGRATRIHSDVFPIRRLVTAFGERARTRTMKLKSMDQTGCLA